MPLLLPGAYSADSVMTQRWGDRTNVSGDLPQVHTKPITTSSESRQGPLSPTSSSSSSPPGPPLIKYLPEHRRAAVHATKTRSNAFTQVRKLTGNPVRVLLIALVLMAQPASGKPWIDEQVNKVTFRSRICQPVPVAELKKMMGPAFDENKMATDPEAAKRLMPDFDGQDFSGLQGDDPRVSVVLTGEDLVEDEREFGSEEEVLFREEAVYTDSEMYEHLDEQARWGRRTSWPPGRTASNRRLSSGISSSSRKSYRHRKYGMSDDDFGDDTDKKRKTVFSDSYAYMRRRRRRSLDFTDNQKSGDRDGLNPEYEEDGFEDDDVGDEDVNTDDDFDDMDDDDVDSKDKKSKDILPLRLILSGKNKKLRRQLKKKIRQKARNLKKPPPWECKMQHSVLMMKEGVFPKYVQDGRCLKAKCFYHLYNCEPIKYAVKLMQRDPDHCNPLPSLSNTTIFEESWKLVAYHATAGCNCASVSVKRKGKKRRRD